MPEFDPKPTRRWRACSRVRPRCCQVRNAIGRGGTGHHGSQRPELRLLLRAGCSTCRKPDFRPRSWKPRTSMR